MSEEPSIDRAAWYGLDLIMQSDVGQRNLQLIRREKSSGAMRSVRNV
jgi:hypothetical protein